MTTKQENEYLRNSYLKADRIMLLLIGAHFLFASFVSSIAYETYLFGFTNGGLLFLLTIASYIFFKGERYFRITAAVVLMAFSSIYIQQHLGRIEFHFHIFVAISFLTTYRDYLPVVVAGATTAAYHIIFNILQEQNIAIFGEPVYIFSYGCGWEIVFLHIFFAILQVIVLSISIMRSKKAFLEVVDARNKYETLSQTLEDEVLQRTIQLRKVNKLYKDSQAITHVGNLEWNITTNRFALDDEIYRIFEMEPQSMFPKFETFIRFVHPEDRDLVRKGVNDAINENIKYDITHRLQLLDNSVKYVRGLGQVYRDEENRPVRMIGTLQDITSEMKIKNELQNSENKFRIMSERTSTAIFIFKDTFAYVNKAMEDITGYSKEELALIGPASIINIGEMDKANKNIQRRVAGEFFTEEYDSVTVTRKDGDKRIVSLNVVTIDYEGGFAGLGTLIDMTEIKEAQEKIKTLSQVVEQTDDIVKITNENGVLTYVNDAFVAQTGYTRREIVGKKPSYLKSGKHDAEFYAELWSTIRSGNVFRSILINKKKDSTLYHEEQTITPIVNENGKTTSFVSTGKDITDRMLLEEKLQTMATTDKLTNCHNRHRFDEILRDEIERFERYQTPLSLIMLDIDHFKKINDKYGHDVGDSVLIEFSTLVKNSIRKMDKLSRWGGEEFILLCPQTKIEEAQKLGEKLRLLIENYEFETAGSVTSSFGVTSFTKDDDSKQLLKRLDNALYMAKERGRNCLVSL